MDTRGVPSFTLSQLFGRSRSRSSLECVGLPDFIPPKKCRLGESRPAVRSDGWAVYRHPHAIECGSKTDVPADNKTNPLSEHYDRPAVWNIGRMALRSGRHGPLYFSCESGIVKPEILQKKKILLTFQH